MEQDEERGLKEKQFVKMTETPVEKLVATLAVPTVISMLVTNIYNLVDTAFVGKLGNSASGAVGVVFGYMAILQAVAFMCGQGAGSIMSRSLGNRDNETATRYTSTGFFMSFLLGALIGIGSFVCLDTLVYKLGSTATIAPYAKSYITWIILAAPFMSSSLTLNNLLRYEGRAKLGMCGLMVGAVLNIGGDAALIFGCKLGIAGAGISTAFSQIVSFLILLGMFLSGKTQTKIRISCVDIHLKTVGNIIATGFPSLLRQALNSIATIILNSSAAAYGDAAVAAMSIVSRINFFMMALAIGIGQGFQPVSGFNYGAGKYDRVKKAFWFCFKSSTVFLLAVSAMGFVFAPQLVALFRDDPEVIAIGAAALRFQCLTFAAHGWVVMSNMMLQTIGRTVPATFLAMARQGIFFIPLVWILSSVLGLLGIQMTQMISDLLTLACSIPIQLHTLRTLERQDAPSL